MDLLIIGAGLSGAVIAERAAKKGKKVLVLERRENIGGNIFDKDIDGVRTHIYGPHIFHTDEEEVNKYMNKFWKLNEFKNIVEAKVKDAIIPLPFNFRGIDRFFSNETEEIKIKLKNKYGEGKRVTIFELMNQDDNQLKKVAQFVYENIFLNYTSKMWGKDISEIDKSVASRVPIIIGYGQRYFSNKYEGIPVDGYATTIEKMFKHKNIEIRTNVDAIQEIEIKDRAIYFEYKKVECPIVYSGQIDELFAYSEGVLPYRSLSIEFETQPIKQIQATAVLNDPSHPEITRTTEHKLFNPQIKIGNETVISSERPGKYKPNDKKFGIPYYPMPDDASRKQYQKYVDIASKFDNLHLVGRLATYQYLDMDKTIKLALDKAKEILG